MANVFGKTQKNLARADVVPRPPSTFSPYVSAESNISTNPQTSYAKFQNLT